LHSCQMVQIERTERGSEIKHGRVYRLHG
jgi:hypothetical protein